MKTHTWEQAVEWLRSDPQKQEFVRQCYYDDPAIDAARRFAQSEEWRETKRLLGEKIPGDILDVGAGRGIASYAFGGEGCRVTALEPDESAIVGAGCIESLNAHLTLPIRVERSCGEKMPFADGTFDIVYGRSVFHHAQDVKAFMRECYRVLRPGGICMMARDHVLEREEELEAFWKSHPLHHLYGGEMAYRLPAYLAAMRDAGFQSIRHFHHWASVINYPTFGHATFVDMITSTLKKRMPLRVAQTLASCGWVQLFFRQWFYKKFRKPGDLFTFVACK